MQSARVTFGACEKTGWSCAWAGMQARRRQDAQQPQLYRCQDGVHTSSMMPVTGSIPTKPNKILLAPSRHHWLLGRCCSWPVTRGWHAPQLRRWPHSRPCSLSASSAPERARGSRVVLNQQLEALLQDTTSCTIMKSCGHVQQQKEHMQART